MPAVLRPSLPRPPLLFRFGLGSRRLVGWANQEVTSYSGFVQEHEAIMEQYSELVRKDFRQALY